MMRPLLFATNYYVVANLQIQWIARMMYFQALSLASKNFNAMHKTLNNCRSVRRSRSRS